MDRLGYTAMSAATRTMNALEVRANNLANVNTPGFRAYMEHAEASNLDGYGYDSRHMARIRTSGVDLTPGTVTTTGRNLDIAIQGAGLFAVIDNDTEVYTRHGSLTVDSDQRLTINGRAVVGDGGEIILPEYQSLHIGNDGTISIVPRGETQMVDLARIKTVDAAAADVVKNDRGLLISKTGAPLEASDTVRILSGHLEMSNVSTIDQLVATMSLSRSFETQVKMMRAAESLSESGNRMIRGS
jgi:flagellar basal-body rod protein FlgF